MIYAQHPEAKEKRKEERRKRLFQKLLDERQEKTRGRPQQRGGGTDKEDRRQKPREKQGKEREPLSSNTYKICFGQGHWAINCPSKGSKEKRKANSPAAPMMLVGAESD